MKAHLDAHRPMPPPSSQPPVPYEQLAAALKALAYPARLELLDGLRFPKTLGEIHLRPRRGETDGEAGRSAARPTVKRHLDQLVDARLLEVDQVAQGGRDVPRYVVNPVRLYALVEEMRRLSTLYAGRGGVGEHTGTLGDAHQPHSAEGPRLVLVHGVYEGKAFPLTDTTASAEQWCIGRQRDLPISLDYDPYVSLENSVVERDEEGFCIRDLGSKNGTSVNWSLVEDAPVRLRPADIIGVGRSLLCFATS